MVRGFGFVIRGFLGFGFVVRGSRFSGFALGVRGVRGFAFGVRGFHVRGFAFGVRGVAFEFVVFGVSRFSVFEVLGVTRSGFRFWGFVLVVSRFGVSGSGFGCRVRGSGFSGILGFRGSGFPVRGFAVRGFHFVVS